MPTAHYRIPLASRYLRSPLSLAISAALVFSPSVQAQQALPQADDRGQISGLKYLNNTTYPTGYRDNRQWLVAGLSGIDFDPASNRFAVVRDNVMAGAVPNGSAAPNVLYLAPSSQAGEPGYRLTFTGEGNSLDGQPLIDTPESVRFDPHGKGLWFTNEGTGSLFHWQQDNSRVQVTLPANAQGNPSGNKGLEGMTFTPSGDLWISSERNKPGDPERLSRFSQVDSQGNVLKQFVYQLDDLSQKSGRLDQENGVSEILAADDKTLLVMERAWDGTSATADKDRSHNSIRIYRVDLSAGQDVKNSDQLTAGVSTLPKTLVFDSASLGSVLNTYETKIDNIEGMTFGPRLPNGHASLVLVSDNNNSKTQGKTQFVVFAVNSPVPEVQFWDGDGAHMADGSVGGDGIWRASETLENWAREGGWINDAWGSKQAVFAGAPGTVTLDARAGTITTSGLNFLSNGYRLQGDALHLTQQATGVLVDGEQNQATLAAPLRGEGGMRKTGAGTLVLSGDSDYTGPTRIDAGTLQVDGSLTSAVTVADKARLSGHGTVGAATVTAGGTLDPAGKEIGTLAVADKLVLGAGANLDVDLDATHADSVQAGILELAGSTVTTRAQNLDPSRADFRPADRYQILTAKGGLTGQLGKVYENFAYLTPFLSYDANSAWLSFDRTSQKTTPADSTRSLVKQYDALRQNHPEIAGPLYPGYNGGKIIGNTPQRDDHNIQVVRDYRSVNQARLSQALRDNNNLNMGGMVDRARGNLDSWVFNGIGGENGNPFMNLGSDSPGKLHELGKSLSSSPRPTNIPVASGGVTPINGITSDSSSFPSGHTAKGTGANLLAAYIYPERFQAFVNRAQEYGESRVVLGVHYPLDTMASRAMTYQAVAEQLAQQMSDPASWLNTTAKPNTIRQGQLDRCKGGGFANIAECASARTSGAHDLSFDSWEEYQQQLAYYNKTKDYGFDAFLKAHNITLGRTDLPMEVPENAEYLIFSRYPYLDRQQLRDIIRTTADPSGRVLDDPWSRINLFRAAEGYGRFDQDVTVTMATANAQDDTAPGAHFNAADRWRNDIDGPGALIKRGDGELTLGGDNRFGGFSLEGGGLTFTRSNALTGDVQANAGRLAVNGGTLRTTGAFTLGERAALTLDNATLSAERALTLVGSTSLTGSNVIEVAATGNALASGAISGAGALDKRGSGTLTLSGDNTYQGGTTVSAGLLQLTRHAALGSTVNVAKDAGLAGSGSVGDIHIAAGGRLAPGEPLGVLQAKNVTLDDHARYAVGVNAAGESGRLQASGKVMIGNNVDVLVTPLSQDTNGSTYRASTRYTLLTAGQGVTGQFAKVLENFAFLDANLTQDGHNVYLTLNRTNSNGGGEDGGGDEGGGGDGNGGTGGDPLVLTPAQGPQVVTSADQFGQRLLQFEGGTLATNLSLQLANPMTLANGGGTLETASNATLTLTGAISGTGGLTKTGNGAVRLAGDNSYSGETRILAGRLAVNGRVNGTVTVANGATLGGSGQVGSATVNGHLAPGNSIGTLTVNGPLTFASGSVYDVEVNAAGASDRTVVNGAVTIGKGVTVAVTPENLSEDGSSYRAYTRYQILDAKDGITGQFAGVKDSFAFLTASLDSQASGVGLILTRNATPDAGDLLHFADVVDTPNQKATATAVESLGSGNTLYDSVLYLPDGAPANAFDQLSGELHPAVASLLIDQSNQGRRILGQRLRSTWNEGASPTLPTDADQSLAQDGQPGAWFEVLGGHSDYDSDGNGHDLSISDGRGIFVGVDGKLASDWHLGVAAGYNGATIGVSGLDASASVDSYHLGLYAGHRQGAFDFSLGALYSGHTIDSKRGVAIPRFSEHLKADYNAHTAQLFSEAAYNLQIGGLHWQPYAGLAYVDFDSDGFRESGGSAGLRGADVHQNQAYGNLGVRAAAPFNLGSSTGALSVGLGWQHAFSETKVSESLAFTGSQPFQVSSMAFDRNSLGVEVQASLNLSDRMRMGVRYDGKLASDSRDQSVNAMLSVSF